MNDRKTKVGQTKVVGEMVQKLNFEFLLIGPCPTEVFLREEAKPPHFGTLCLIGFPETWMVQGKPSYSLVEKHPNPKLFSQYIHLLHADIQNPNSNWF